MGDIKIELVRVFKSIIALFKINVEYMLINARYN